MSDSALVPVDFGPIEQVAGGTGGVEFNGFQDALYNRKANRSVDPADVSQRLVTSALYELPFGPGKRWNPASGVLSRIVGGWQINLISVMQSGIPLTVRGASNFQADRPNSTGRSAELPGDQRSAQRWFDTAQFVNPPDFTFGNVGRTIPDVRHPGTMNFDGSLIKDTQITERVRLQFRVGGIQPGEPRQSWAGGRHVCAGSGRPELPCAVRHHHNGSRCSRHAVWFEADFLRREEATEALRLGEEFGRRSRTSTPMLTRRGQNEDVAMCGHWQNPLPETDARLGDLLPTKFKGRSNSKATPSPVCGERVAEATAVAEAG